MFLSSNWPQDYYLVYKRIHECLIGLTIDWLYGSLNFWWYLKYNCLQLPPLCDGVPLVYCPICMIPSADTSLRLCVCGCIRFSSAFHTSNANWLSPMPSSAAQCVAKALQQQMRHVHSHQNGHDSRRNIEHCCHTIVPAVGDVGVNDSGRQQACESMSM